MLKIETRKVINYGRYDSQLYNEILPSLFLILETDLMMSVACHVQWWSQAVLGGLAPNMSFRPHRQKHIG